MYVDRKPAHGTTLKEQRAAEREAAFKMRTEADIDTMPTKELCEGLSAMVHSTRSCYILGTSETKGLGKIRAGMVSTHKNRNRA